MKSRGIEYHLADKMIEEIKNTSYQLIDVAISAARTSVIDELTGLYNRKGFETGKKIIKRSLDNGEIKNVGIILIDIDGLKIENDTNGHASGDKLIIDTATILQGSVRQDDNVFRIGGDELALLLPEVDDQILKERIRIIKENRDKYGKNLFFSWGIGYADHSAELDDAIKTADANMYKAKRARKK